jgi:hypothetical protein
MRTTLPVLAATTALLTVTGAGIAAAAPPERGTVYYAFPITTCATGETISTYADVEFRRWNTYAEDGSVVTQTLTMVYTGGFINEDTGEEVPMHGTRHLTLDFANDYYTDSGNLRTTTQPGEGWVLKRAGRFVGTISSNEPTFISGPNFDEMSPGVDTSAVLCGMFGLQGVPQG